MSKKTKQWIDENGLVIPVSRVTPLEKKVERYTNKLLRDAERINKMLSEFKDEVSDRTQELWYESLLEAGLDDETIAEKKGNHTIYNFDRSIKIEVSVSERIDFDDALIVAAKEKFDEFLGQNTTGIDEMIRQLIMDAFSTYRGKLDAKKIMSLVRYKSKISERRYPNFHAAVSLIEESIRRPDSRRYFRIWKRNQTGEYENIDLNFSSI